MKFSVIIVEYASWHLTLQCIESLKATGYKSFELVVVDNGNHQRPELPPGTKLLRNGRNCGFARAVNQGVAASTGEIVVLINPDTLVGKNFFENIEVFFNRVPKAGIVGPRVLDTQGSVQLSARREVSVASGILGRTSIVTKLFPNSSLVRRQFPATTEASCPARVDWVSGACMAIYHETLKRVGPLDERFFMYFEDADLCRRTRESGWEVYYLPSIEVTHQTGGSTRERVLANWNLHKSAFVYHRKHGPHGPHSLFSVIVLFGLAARASVRLGTDFIRGMCKKAKRET